MKKILSFVIIMLLLSTTTVCAIIESNIIYKLNPTNIQLTNMEIDVKDTKDVKTFDDSMSDLNDLLTTSEPGATSTQIYYDSNANKENNILKVDVDFKGLTIPAPTNVVFLMDQSGSMNMSAEDKSYSANASPCMNEDHYYRIRLNIDDKPYVYYYNPQEAGFTDSWGNIRTLLLNYIKTKAIEQGIATSSSKISYVNIYLSESDAPERNHYESANFKHLGYDNTEDKNRFFEIQDTSKPFETSEEEKKYFSKINLGFLETNNSAVNEYYSPAEWYNTPGAPTTPDWRATGSDEYFNYLRSNSLCYDRMLVAKVLFEELSDMAVAENPDNEVGFVKYAITNREERPLESTNFENTGFGELTGYAGTNWSEAYLAAETMFQSQSYGQNIAIMVTDGRPYQGGTATEFIKTLVDRIATENDALMAFVGVSLDNYAMTTYSEAASTTDSEGNNLAYNGKSLEDFKGIIEYLEAILTSTSQMSTTIGDMLNLEISENHPITLEYVYNYEGKDVKETKTIYSLESEEAKNLGISYNADAKTIEWDMQKIGIHSARLSYYESIKAEDINWDDITNGGTVSGNTNKDVNVDYIDQTGAIKDLQSNETASFVVENVSYLTIQNTTSTPYNVDVNDVINYQITVTNTGTLDSDNNFVYQQVPVGTKYLSSPDGIYDEGKNLIIFEIPDLKAGETLVFNYSVTAIEYDFEINSQARLGVKDQPVTLFDDGTPILEAEILTHRTPKPETNIPDTGDNYNVVYYVIGILIALLVILLLMVKKKETK